MSEPQKYDFAILGGGSAGYAAARTAVQLGLRTVLMDGAEELGGLCVLRGCMPSKTLIESGNRNLTLRHASRFGLKAEVGEPDTRFIRDRKRRLVSEFLSYRQGQLHEGKFAFLQGFGKFEKSDENSVRLTVNLREGGTVEIEAGAALIATGSSIKVPPVPGLDEARYWTSDTLLDAAEIPKSFIVLGGGAIALEMAHYLEAIGRNVTILQRNVQLLTGIDMDVADVVQRSFMKRGMKIRTGTKLERVEHSDGVKRVVYSQQDVSHHVEAEEILAALGRKPETSSLGLENIGVPCRPDCSVAVQDTQQSQHPRIFAAGDVCGPLEVVHLAIQQGETAAKNVAALLRGEPFPAHMDYRAKLYGIFTEPQVAVVGLSEQELTRQHIPYHRSTYPFDDHGKSMVKGETEGFVKLMAHADTGEILGGAVVGPEGTELIHEISVAIHLHATAEQLAMAPHYHPTLSEIWTYPAEELAELVKQA